MADLSIFADESGSDDLKSKYFILILVLHNQENSISSSLLPYESALETKELPHIPFHTSPLLYGKDQYKNIDIATRKQMLSVFRVMFRHLPITYIPFCFKTSEYTSSGSLSDYMKKKLVEHIQENLTFYQRFDSVKIYYDGGQECVSTALRNAYGQTISKEAFVYKPINASEFCLAQVSDYICTIELTAIKYQEGTSTSTDEKFFGKWGQFKKGVLKEVRAKRF